MMSSFTLGVVAVKARKELWENAFLLEIFK
jgi:hypothetical protein